MPQIIVAGLGPGAWEHVTIEVKTLLDAASTIYLRTRTHPTANHLPAHLDVRTFDYLYEREEEFERIYRQIAEELISLASAATPDPIIYCVPGHPVVGEASVRHLRSLASNAGITVKLVAGLSFIEPVCTALGIDPLERGLQIVDGTDLAGYGTQTANNRKSEEPFLFSPYSLPVAPDSFPAVAGLSPMYPVLLCQVYNDRVASACKLILMERYHDEHPARSKSYALPWRS
jgi:tetrapyrrole methylase family protein/MazG family protein